MLLFQFTASPNQQAFTQSQVVASDLQFFAIMVALGIVGIVVLLFLIRLVLTNKNKAMGAFNRTILRIMVPKERKSEGQGGQVGSEDRLEQVKEEIAITETFFSTIAGLRAQRGIKPWLSGREDSISFEIVMQNGQIYFYIESSKKLSAYLSQQIHAQYPHAQIEETPDYNIFSKNSSVVGGYLKSVNKPVFPFKTYKKM